MNIHFIAVGGAIMHNLAIALHKKGYQISGSDDIFFEPSKSRLKKYGLLPKKQGWFSERITDDLNAVILGVHAQKNNPELLKAQEKGIKIYSYPEFIYKQSKNKTRVVIGGSHGKTTITAMVLHVLKYCDKAVDYVVGAQLEGFDTMVHLTTDNEFIVLEGDEYLASPIDLRSKFHLYQPNIALISGIAWDHINIFPTSKNYEKQFEFFIDTITDGGILVYNEEDEILKQMVIKNINPIKKYPYQTPQYRIENGQTFLDTFEGDLPLKIFGKHNLQNLAGAKWICQYMGIGEEHFYDAIMSFKGVNERLEKLIDKKTTKVFKDFAHLPSEVKAATCSVKDQYPNFLLVACLELHTYRSLDKIFLNEYKNALSNVDKPVVFYNLQTLVQKKLKPINSKQIKQAFNREDIDIFTDAKTFQEFLFNLSFDYKILLLMSSGNCMGLDFEKFLLKF